MERAQKLRTDVQMLMAGLVAAQHAEPDERERKLIAGCLDLARLHLGYLDAFLAGKSRAPEDRVYLGVNSLNKGFIEICGEWQDRPECSRLGTLVIEKSNASYKEARPPMT